MGVCTALAGGIRCGGRRRGALPRMNAALVAPVVTLSPRSGMRSRPRGDGEEPVRVSRLERRDGTRGRQRAERRRQTAPRGGRFRGAQLQQQQPSMRVAVPLPDGIVGLCNHGREDWGSVGHGVKTTLCSQIFAEFASSAMPNIRLYHLCT